MSNANGFTYASGKLLVEVATPVPATAIFLSGFAFNRATGALYSRVATSPPAGAVCVGGLLLASDGALLFRTTLPTRSFFVQGIIVDADGLVYGGTDAGAATSFGRWPLAATGAVAADGLTFLPGAMDYFSAGGGSQLLRAAAFTGSAVSKKFRGAFAYRIDAIPATKIPILNWQDSNGLGIYLNRDDATHAHIEIALSTAGGSGVWSFVSSVQRTVGSWITCFFCGDSDTLGSGFFYENRVVDPALNGIDAMIAGGQSAFNQPNISFASSYSGVCLNACISSFYLDRASSLNDPSFFITAANKMVDLSAAGSGIGPSAMIWSPNGDMQNNQGTGGSMTAVTNSPTICSSDPNQ